jgi:hypothetical protein
MRRILAIGIALLVVEVAAQPSELKIAPSPLLQIDQHRQSVIDGIVAIWRDTLHASSDAAQREAELRARLMGLRSDRLLAASVAGSFATIESLLSDTDDRPSRRVNGKLGQSTADLTYTPLTPCRIADTRYAGGALQANTPRTLVGYDASSFAGQGGTATNCGIPSGVAALAMNAFAVNPSNLGFIKLYAANSAEPAVSTVNYQPGITAIATGTIVPVDAANASQFIAKSPAQVDLIVDVVGYFKAPGHFNVAGTTPRRSRAGSSTPQTRRRRRSEAAFQTM